LLLLLLLLLLLIVYTFVNKVKRLLELFYIELCDIFIRNIKSQHLVGLRSNLRSFNYVYLPANTPECRLFWNSEQMKSPEQIVREQLIRRLILTHLPISLFMHRDYNVSGSSITAKSKSELDSEKEKTDDLMKQAFDNLYNDICKEIGILFHSDVMFNNILNNIATTKNNNNNNNNNNNEINEWSLLRNDFIANSVWYELIQILLSDSYKEMFLSIGIPDKFYQHYKHVMNFFKRLQQLYYCYGPTEIVSLQESTSEQKQADARPSSFSPLLQTRTEFCTNAINFDEIIYQANITKRFHKECNLYFIFPNSICTNH
ncbi:hypothetical protein RFI_07713, partial [Reticulomyxa filosa]